MVGYGFDSRRRLGTLTNLPVYLFVGWPHRRLMRPSDQRMKRLEKMGSYPSGQRGLTVNQLAAAFGGSNPSPPTFAALIAQSVEHILGKNGVMGSNPIEGSCYSKLFG